MKWMLALLAVISVGIGLAACGSGNNSTTSVSEVGSSGQRFKGDGDYDSPKDTDNDNNVNDGDNDTDGYFDSKNDGHGYYDSDDHALRENGKAASAVEGRTIAALVQQYYAAGIAGDGTRACALLVPAVANTAAVNYGGGLGPAYLRGAQTCGEVVSRIFRRDHNELTAAIKVMAVRVAGQQANVLFGSSTMPSSYIPALRVGGVWKVGTLTGTIFH